MNLSLNPETSSEQNQLNDIQLHYDQLGPFSFSLKKDLKCIKVCRVAQQSANFLHLATTCWLQLFFAELHKEYFISLVPTNNDYSFMQTLCSKELKKRGIGLRPGICVKYFRSFPQKNLSSEKTEKNLLFTFQFLSDKIYNYTKILKSKHLVRLSSLWWEFF